LIGGYSFKNNRCDNFGEHQLFESEFQILQPVEGIIRPLIILLNSLIRISLLKIARIDL